MRANTRSAFTLLAQIIKRRTGISVPVSFPISEEDDPGVSHMLADLISKARLEHEYAHWLARFWRNKAGVAMANASLDERCKAVLAAVSRLKPAKHVIFLGAGASYSSWVSLGESVGRTDEEAPSVKNRRLKSR